MIKQESFEFTVKVKAPEGTKRGKVKTMVRQAIDSGLLNGADAALATQMKVTVSDQPLPSPSPVGSPVGDS